MTWVAKDGGLGVSGWLSSAYTGGGILGADIPTEGLDGGSPAVDETIDPASEYYWRATRLPTTGTLRMFEDLTFTWAPDGETGSDSFDFERFKNYGTDGAGTVYLSVGDSGATGDATADSGSVAGSASGGAPSDASGNVTADSGSVGGVAGTEVVSIASGDATADSGSVGGLATGGAPSGASGGVTADSGAVAGGAVGLFTEVQASGRAWRAPWARRDWRIFQER